MKTVKKMLVYISCLARVQKSTINLQEEKDEE